MKNEDNKHTIVTKWCISVQAIADIFYISNAMLIDMYRILYNDFALFCDMKPRQITKESYFKHSTDVMK